ARVASSCGFGSCPFRFLTRTCSRESSQAPTLTQSVRLLPSLLVCPWPSSPGTDLPRRTVRVRLPPDTLTPCEEADVHRPGCLPGKTGSIPVQGATSGRGLSGEATV